FDNWQYGGFESADGIVSIDCCPAGRQSDFVARAYIAVPTERELADFFNLAPRLLRQALSQNTGITIRPTEAPTKMTCGGAAAMSEGFELSGRGVSRTCRVIYVKHHQYALAVLGAG